jgi:hypothetical protein
MAKRGSKMVKILFWIKIYKKCTLKRVRIKFGGFWFKKRSDHQIKFSISRLSKIDFFQNPWKILKNPWKSNIQVIYMSFYGLIFYYKPKKMNLKILHFFLHICTVLFLELGFFGPPLSPLSGRFSDLTGFSNLRASLTLPWGFPSNLYTFKKY